MFSIFSIFKVENLAKRLFVLLNFDSPNDILHSLNIEDVTECGRVVKVQGDCKGGYLSPCRTTILRQPDRGGFKIV